MVSRVGTTGAETTAQEQSTANAQGLSASDIGMSRSSGTAGTKIQAQVQADQAARDKDRAQDTQAAGSATSTVGDVFNSLSSIPYVGIVFAIIGTACKVAGSVVTAAGAEEGRRAEVMAQSASQSISSVQDAEENIKNNQTKNKDLYAADKANRDEKKASSTAEQQLEIQSDTQQQAEDARTADALNVANGAGVIPGGSATVAGISAGTAGQSGTPVAA